MKSLPVLIDGVYYISSGEASKVIGMHKDTIKQRCRSKNFKNFQFTEYRLPIQKKCGKCGKIKELSLFKKTISSVRDGRSSWCKKCHSEYTVTHTDNIKRKDKDRKYRISEKGRVTIKYNKERRRSFENNSKIKLTKEEKKYVKWLHWKVRIMRKNGFDVHLDHIIPVSKGGLHIPENLRIIHAQDNILKGNNIL